MESSGSPAFRYQADELQLFAHAQHWKAYWVSRMIGFLRGDVLEVGAGIGANTQLLRPLCSGRYVCLEPDVRLVQQLKLNLGPVFHVETVTGMVASLPPLDRFDTAIYIDVLEHIEDDRAELSAVAKHIRPGGHIIVLSPAFQALYSPFDEAIGHYRRYSRSSLLRCAPPGFSLMRVEYLDSLGAILSFGNRTLLRRHYPTLVQILFWDRWVVPLSRLTDRLTGFGIGRTILGVWQIPE